MKRLLAILLVVTTLLCMLPVSAADTTQKPIEVYYLGQKLVFPVPPQLINGSTMVPMRAIFEALGYSVLWDADTKKITAVNTGYSSIVLTIGSKTALVNEQERTLDCPPALVNSTTVVPLRFIGEASGYLVTWKSEEGASRIDIERSETMLSEIALQKNSYIEDLRLVKTDLPKLHKNLFFYKSQEAFNSEMDALIKAVPNLQDDQIKFELMRIINSINDTHTVAAFKSGSNLGLSFFQFEDGIYLINAPESFNDFIGLKLTGIQEYSIDDVIRKLTPILPFENESWKKQRLSEMLICPEYLRIAGVIKNELDDVKFIFGKKSIEASTTFALDPMASQSEQMKNNYPFFFGRNTKYWYSILDDKKALYIRYNNCSNMFSNPFEDMVKEAFSKLDEKGYTKLIIDIRNNTGGNSSIIQPLVNEIQKRSKINQDRHLYVIVGRGKFSSAILNTMQLKIQTKAKIVGEETGGSPNHYGNIKNFELPNLEMLQSYSTHYYNTMPGNAKTLTPDIVVTPKASSFFSGKDDFLEAVYTNMAK